jgi:hypothetical protein
MIRKSFRYPFVLLCTAAAMLISSCGSDEDVLKDIYSRICIDIIRDRATRPSSFEVNEVLTSTEALSLQEAMSIKMANGLSDDLEEFMLEVVSEEYANGRESRHVDIFVDYSAENKLGGFGRDVANCRFLEDAMDSESNSELVAIQIGSTEVTRDGFIRFFLLSGSPDRLNSIYRLDGITMTDRLRSITNPIID